GVHEPLGEYVDRLGFCLNNLSKEGPWPDRVVKVGSSLALLAYRETGYYNVIDEEAFQLGCLAAVASGVPETFISSARQDEGLQELVEGVLAIPDFTDNEGGYRQVLEIGAACTRHYMQQALAA